MEKEQPYPQAEIITLALHVDYWNHLGWKDEFSSPLFSQRQEFYVRAFKLGSAYTPQMIVDGKTQFTGSDLGKAATAIAEAAKIQKAKIEIVEKDGRLTVKIAELPAHENANVYLAFAEDNLATDVKRGENNGKRLNHQSVVRELRSIGTLNADRQTFESETVLQLSPNWNREHLKIVVFVQENASRKILGVKRLALHQN